ncbi:adhesion G-protein coupled receptor F1 [Nothobranchius furzeri]|uniref:adhesion G-protein coupled receptor F1 n=1 Tax=Nothobranchius furzeri TaxID=105023 RepID=UPI003904CDEB
MSEFRCFWLHGLAPGPDITALFKTPDDCPVGESSATITCQTVDTVPVYDNKITLDFTNLAIKCFSDTFGDGTVGFVGMAPCKEYYVGHLTAVCTDSGVYDNVQDYCILAVVKELLDQSESLNGFTLPVFLEQLSNVTLSFFEEVMDSPPTIAAIVKILDNVAITSSSNNIIITQKSMKNVMETGGILTTDEAKGSWKLLNNKDDINGSEKNPSGINSNSSLLLHAFEKITSRLVNESFNIQTPYILLNKTTFSHTFIGNFNSSVEIDVLEADGENNPITVILFSSMDNVLLARDKANSSSDVINGKVTLIKSEAIISNLTLSFETTNDTLKNPKCVFWDFTLFDGVGGWSQDGCSLVYYENGTASCNCNHTTSFSILMSPDSIDSPILDYITYIGVGISMASLVICLIIEAIVWRKIRKNATSYLRHVSIVNIAVSLLMADIWFIIGAAISNLNEKNQPACTAATFFIHFFYLALFFWMLASALLLLYRTVSVFDGGLSKVSMLVIGFVLGYGAPLIIATVTIAATAPSNEYTRENSVCWLNWYESKALLAFVIPALLIVLINLIILVVVLYKILRRRVGGNAAQSGEKHVLVVIARSLAVLTPFFGITWGLGVGTMVKPDDMGILITFALFNSLQGFFILVFGTLLDKKVLSGLSISSLSSTGQRTRSTSAGSSSSGLENWFRKLRRRRGSNGYNLSSNGSNESFSNT